MISASKEPKQGLKCADSKPVIGSLCCQLSSFSWTIPSDRTKLHPFSFFYWFKQKKKNRKLQEETFSDDDEDDFENGEFEEETDLPLNYKQLTVHMKSPRADALLSTGLNLSRVKIDSMFYAGKLLHNDKPLTKKSKNVNEGDNVDLIMEDSEIVKVKRVKVLKISSEKTQTDKICVILRVWRSPFSLESLHEES
ncbi:unnamed protein product [Acanthosepion pharaonis]|uniref:Mitochondrial transcription rescue factor 1 C-terminal domain-containing protein n=1 Tax=Acanthosepion pharaonis TaxID=158019 RepID=A0A812D4D7_ACAPH|nr:unnamed protein product [Sepia pharaonis]